MNLPQKAVSVYTKNQADIVRNDILKSCDLNVLYHDCKFISESLLIQTLAVLSPCKAMKPLSCQTMEQFIGFPMNFHFGHMTGMGPNSVTNNQSI